MAAHRAAAAVVVAGGVTVPSTLVAVLTPLEHDPAELRSRAQELLSRPPYVEHEPGLFTRLLERLGDLVAWFLDAISISGGAPTAWAILVLGVVLLLVVVWRTTRGMTVDVAHDRDAKGDGARTSGEWFALADEHTAAGRLRDAVRCRYSGMVAAMEASGVIDRVPGRTVHELDAEVRTAAPRVAAEVAAAGERFEALVYGGVPARTADVEIVNGAADAVVRTLARGERRLEVGA